MLSGLAGIIYQSTVYELKIKTAGSIGQGMGNGIFWSQIVKGLPGACTHPLLDIFSRVFRSNLPEVSLAFNSIFLFERRINKPF